MTVALSEIFDVRYGHSLELNRLTRARFGEGVAFVSRKMGDNGISAFVEPIPGVDPAPAGDLSCALGGNGVLTTHLQEQPFYVGRDVALLRPKVELSKSQILFYCFCVKVNRFRYSYGRQANKTLGAIQVPAVSAIPDWVDSVDLDMFSGADSPKVSGEVLPDLHGKAWGLFGIKDLFDLRKGRRLTKAQLKLRPGDVPFIGAIDNNNGLSNFVDVAIHDGCTITVVYNGAGVADAFFQPVPFWASDDVNVLYPKFELSADIALFLTTVIRKEKYRFSYGRKWHLERMLESQIHLPVDAKGEPDWVFMKGYIASLPFSSQIYGEVD
ncbi:restriction endonuclease subunit S [Phaeovulum sp. W22_SRMD_FR3]|uniref:restriction endonuclease subunit S n=1 Tax=Phaeovulum sp. W22_SRMD_FR3 TaxID=3240274 RepID=UPI003F9CB822